MIQKVYTKNNISLLSALKLKKKLIKLTFLGLSKHKISSKMTIKSAKILFKIFKNLILV